MIFVQLLFGQNPRHLAWGGAVSTEESNETKAGRVFLQEVMRRHAKPRDLQRNTAAYSSTLYPKASLRDPIHSSS